MLFPINSRTGTTIESNAPFNTRPSASAMGTGVTAGGTQHTLGSSFTTLITSTVDAYSIGIVLSNTSQTDAISDGLLNIYVGASSSEVLFIEGLMGGWAPSPSNGNRPKQFWFPLYIPAGTRLSAKYQSVIAGFQIRATVFLYGGGQPPHWVGRGVETLGANFGNSQGTGVTSGSTSDGAFSTLGNTTKRYGYIQPMMQGSLSGVPVATSTMIFADIGSADSVVSGLENFCFGVNNSEQSSGFEYGRFCDIPSGIGLQIRSQSHTTAMDNDFVIHGVY